VAHRVGDDHGAHQRFLFQAFRIGLNVSLDRERVTTTRQTIKARWHGGVLQPLEPLTLADEAEVQVTVDTDVIVSADEILLRAARVYQGLTADQVVEVEAIALDRRQFFREPAA